MLTFPKLTKLAKILIIINAIIWVLEVIFLRTSFAPVVNNLFLTPKNVVENGYIWQLLTYMFTHSPNMIFHIILNMLILWMFSEQLQTKWGDRRFIFFYIFAGVVGGIFVILEGIIFIPEHYIMPTLGASASIFALTTAFALTFPEMQILLLIIPIKAKYLIHIDLAIIVLSYLAIGNDGVSDAAHLGGMFAAFLVIKLPWYKVLKRKNRKITPIKGKSYIKRVK